MKWLNEVSRKIEAFIKRIQWMTEIILILGFVITTIVITSGLLVKVPTFVDKILDLAITMSAVAAGIPVALYLSKLQNSASEEAQRQATLKVAIRAFKKNLFLLDQIVNKIKDDESPSFRMHLIPLNAMQPVWANVIEEEDSLEAVEIAHYECGHVDNRLEWLAGTIPFLYLNESFSGVHDAAEKGTLRLAAGDFAAFQMSSGEIENNFDQGAIGKVLIALDHLHRLSGSQADSDLQKRIEENYILLSKQKNANSEIE